MTNTPAIVQEEDFPFQLTCRACGDTWLPEPKMAGLQANGLPVRVMSSRIIDESARRHWQDACGG